MLVIERQPSPLVPHEFKPTEWAIRKTDILTVTGGNAQIYVAFSDGSAGAAGQEITLLGQTFTTSASSSAYTSISWYYSGTAEEAAKNFANMVRTSYLFAGWSISVSGTGAGWLVTMIRNEVGALSEFTNSVSGLSPSASLSDVNGIDEVRSTDRFWYQFWEGNEAISEQKFAFFDQTGRVRVDAESTARQVLGVTDPYLLWTSPRYDERMSRQIYLRFGTLTQGDGCDTSYGESYESPDITIVNALFQHEKVLRFYPYTPNYTLPVKWMTARPTERNTCRESYEWMAIFLQRSALFPDRFYRIVYTYYNSVGGVLNTKTENLTNQPDGVYHVPTGPGNGIHPTGVISLASYYTVQVQVRGDDLEYTTYSETHTLRLTSCNCWAAEVYYLEDAGSWHTVVFENVDSRSIEMSAVEWQGPVTYSQYGGTPDGIRLYQDGGLESFADDAQAVFVLVTERVNESNRKAYEEFLRSSRHIILTSSDAINPVTRRIIVDRGNYGVYTRGEQKRLLIPFRFNTVMRTR